MIRIYFGVGTRLEISAENCTVVFCDSQLSWDTINSFKEKGQHRSEKITLH
jgi:hypothetical protein